MDKNLDEVTEQANELSLKLTTQSQSLTIESTEGLESAAELTRQAKEEIKNIENSFKPHKDNAYKSHKDLCSAENNALAPFKIILSILKPKVIKYTNEQAEIARKAQAEKERAQRELEAKIKKDAEDIKMAHAEKLMDSGDLDMAEAVMEAPTVEVMPAVVPEEKVEKVAGVGTGTKWKARVLDFSKVDDRFKMIDQKAIDAMAKACKNKSTCAGLEFFEETYLTGK